MSLIKRLKKGITICKAKKELKITQQLLKKTKTYASKMEQSHRKLCKCYGHSETALGNSVLQQPLQAYRTQHNWIYSFGEQ